VALLLFFTYTVNPRRRSTPILELRRGEKINRNEKEVESLTTPLMVLGKKMGLSESEVTERINTMRL
jgi:hypothetical protein